MFKKMEDFFSRHYEEVDSEGRVFIRKGLVSSVGNYQVRINAGDHLPPHVHVSVNNEQKASYLISDGTPYRIKKRDRNIDSLMKMWFKNENNRKAAELEWEKMVSK